MRAMVLADRHHADLYWSLQRLFEDRLGCELWTPVGLEWWAAGFWRFGESFGDDRLARQFLAPQHWTRVVAGTWVTRDSHHPDRVIYGIDCEAALEARWDYVVATVDDNQQGLSKFAKAVGAKYVRHIGNVNAWVDWSLDPLVIQPRQEIDETVFRWRAPIGPWSVASFVNCFGSTPCVTEYEAVKALLPQFRWERHGHDEPDGSLETVADIAERMAGVGWAWHDKVQGDGFGHVIFDWAAIGRPLIGHASHYRGMLAEPFWQDLVTCVDLDRHPPAEAAAIIKAVSADPTQHLAMCRAIRAVYDGLVDYEAEASRIAQHLGIAERVPA